MPDTVILPDRIEVTRPIPAPPSAIFDIVRSPAGHVAIDASGMLQDFTGEPAEKVGDRFVIHMDRESLNDMPLGKYDVKVNIIVFDREQRDRLGPRARNSHPALLRVPSGAGRGRGDERDVVLRLVKGGRRHQRTIPDRSGFRPPCHAGHSGAHGPHRAVTS